MLLSVPKPCGLQHICKQATPGFNTDICCLLSNSQIAAFSSIESLPPFKPEKQTTRVFAVAKIKLFGNFLPPRKQNAQMCLITFFLSCVHRSRKGFRWGSGGDGSD